MDESDEIYVIEGCLLESIRFRQGGWRFYFPGSELSVCGEAILQVMGRALTLISPDFFDRLRAILGSELTHACIDAGSVTLSFRPESHPASPFGRGERVRKPPSGGTSGRHNLEPDPWWGFGSLNRHAGGV